MMNLKPKLLRAFISTLLIGSRLKGSGSLGPPLPMRNSSYNCSSFSYYLEQTTPWLVSPANSHRIVLFCWMDWVVTHLVLILKLPRILDGFLDQLLKQTWLNKMSNLYMMGFLLQLHCMSSDLLPACYIPLDCTEDHFITAFSKF